MWGTVLLTTVLCCAIYIFMQLMSKEPNAVKFQFKFCSFYFVTTVVSAVVWPLFLFSPRNVRNVLIATRIIKHTTKICDLEWELRNGEILAEERGAVVLSNHQSSLDILGIMNVWEIADKLTIVAKKQLFYIWPFGLAAYLAGIVFIDRNNAKGAYKTLKDTADVMINNKTKVLLYPEGTRNSKGTGLLPFKKGAFNMAVNAQVPIIPLVLSPYYFIDAKKNIFNKGHIVIQCLKPVPTEGLEMKDVPDLMNRIHDIMETAYRELSKEVLNKCSS